MKKTEAIKEKICLLPELRSVVRQWRLKSKTVVLTDGVFDVPDHGHLALLIEAAKQGDRLIVALRSDDSVKRMKDSDHPINSQEDRALLMAAMVIVDAVIAFEEDSSLALIQSLQPDVLVKTGDDPDAAAAMQSGGGKVVIIPQKEAAGTADLTKNTGG